MASVETRSAQRAPQRRHIYNPSNEFDFDKSKIPPHMTYVWRRQTIAGMEDKRNMVRAEMNGWTPVPASRHPELMGSRATDSESVVVSGLMLMEQPKEYAEEAREMETFEAKNSLEEQIQRLGLQARRNGARGIGRTMEPLKGDIVE